MLDDRTLLEAWRLGESNAGQALLDRYFDHVRYFFAARRGGDVDDLIQQTFEACVQGRDRVRDGGTFRSYLFGVAYNVLRADRRQRRRAERLAGRFGLTPANEPGPSTLVRGKDQARWVREALAQLPWRTRQVLEFHYLEGMSADDIARVVGCPEGTVRSRLRRGRALLRAILVEQDPSRGVEAEGGTLNRRGQPSAFEPT